ncbi:hypothetical protein WA556_003894 [Blastocystis sp. ATCC 50177/Nand II]
MNRFSFDIRNSIEEFVSEASTPKSRVQALKKLSSIVEGLTLPNDAFSIQTQFRPLINSFIHALRMHQEDVIPALFEFLTTLLKRTQQAFNGVATAVTPDLLNYLVSSQSVHRQPCHILIKQILLNNRSNSKFIFDLLQVLSSCILTPAVISCCIEYLSILGSYKPLILEAIVDPMQRAISILKSAASAKQLMQLNELENLVFAITRKPAPKKSSFVPVVLCLTILCALVSIVLIAIPFFPKRDVSLPVKRPARPNYDLEPKPQHQSILVQDENDWVIVDNTPPQEPATESESMLELSVNEDEDSERSVIVGVVLVIMIGYALYLILFNSRWGNGSPDLFADVPSIHAVGDDSLLGMK